MNRSDRLNSIESLRSSTDRAIRVATPHHHIDPGFINKRLCFSVFGKKFIDIFDKYKSIGGGWEDSLANNHLMVDMSLRACAAMKALTLGEVLQSPAPGQIFCSTERLQGVPENDIYENNGRRVENNVIVEFETDRRCFLSYNVSHFVADTGKSEQAQESYISLIGLVHAASDTAVEIWPLVMGAPTFDHSANGELCDGLSWYGYDLYEIFPEDIDQFSDLRTIPRESAGEWKRIMRDLSEQAVKLKIATLLGDDAAKDWGGERLDHYSTTVTVSGVRKRASFMFKGPARFAEMTLDMCGKRADQILRLSATPADLLIVQHCHDVGIAVRDTLRAFAVQPSRPRQYCILDGRDTFRLLKCRNLL